MRLAIIDPGKCIGCQCCMFACSRRSGSAGLAASCIGVRSSGGSTASGFVIVVCRGCEAPPCAKVCPTEALTRREGGGVLLDSTKCTGCGNCRDACILDAVYWDDETNKPMICVHCGYCAEYCPYGVLAKEKKPAAPGINEEVSRLPASPGRAAGAKTKKTPHRESHGEKKSGGRK